MKTVIETIADWLMDYRPTEDDIRLARNAVIDTLACMVAGQGDEVTRAVHAAFEGQLGAGGPALMVTGEMASPSLAALVNGTAAHAIDFDDNFKPGMSHASAVIVPALLAIGNERRASGMELLHAYLVALQAQAFVGSAMAPSHYTAGWHGTSTVGCIGTAAGAAFLIGLDAAGLGRAMSVAASQASGTKGQFGSAIKPVHAGLAARNAVDAALMAKAGLAGRLDILEREQGFLALFGGRSAGVYDRDAIASTRNHVIGTIGVMPKLYPCCGSTHPVLDMILDLAAMEAFDADQVTAIECRVRIANYRNLPFTHPRDEKEARFSMNYCVARALRAGVPVPEDFTPEAVRRHAGDALLDRVSMDHYSEQEEAQDPELPHQLRIVLRDGRVLKVERRLPKGSRIQPLTDEERAAKFLGCCRHMPDAPALFQALEALAGSPCLAPVSRCFGK